MILTFNYVNSEELEVEARQWKWNEGGEGGSVELYWMEDDGGSGGRDLTHRWWAIAGVAQLCWGIASFKKGYVGSSNLMPLKAFGVASLFVGASASAAVAFLKSSGIHKVEDLMEVGANIRTALGVRPRARDE